MFPNLIIPYLFFLLRGHWLLILFGGSNIFLLLASERYPVRMEWEGAVVSRRSWSNRAPAEQQHNTAATPWPWTQETRSAASELTPAAPQNPVPSPAAADAVYPTISPSTTTLDAARQSHGSYMVEIQKALVLL